MRCPKCGYLRKAQEAAPEWQCPSCGVAYAKIAAGSGGDGVARARPADSSSVGKFAMIMLLVIAIGAGVAISSALRTGPDKGSQQLAQQGVVMYSLTTCGFCNVKREELKANNIPFVEHFVDQEPARQQEMFDKLRASGFRGGGVGTPTFEVNGKMLPNNPSLATIRKHL
jgi:glutaredoxin